MAIKKYLKKVGRRVVKAAKKRYVPKGKPNISRITKDVMAMTKLLNVEKKYTESTISVDAAFSQVNYFHTNVTPSIPQGHTGSSRNGNSLKLVAARLDCQVKGDTLLNNSFRYKWFLVYNPAQNDGSSQSSNDVVTRMFDQNIFNNAYYDYHSQRDPEYFNKFKIVARGQGKLEADSISGQAGINQFSKPLRLSQHMRYDANAASLPCNGQYHLIFFGDTGSTAATTGALLSHSIRWWYVDN